MEKRNLITTVFGGNLCFLGARVVFFFVILEGCLSVRRDQQNIFSCFVRRHPILEKSAVELDPAGWLKLKFGFISWS